MVFLKNYRDLKLEYENNVKVKLKGDRRLHSEVKAELFVVSKKRLM